MHGYIVRWIKAVLISLVFKGTTSDYASCHEDVYD